MRILTLVAAAGLASLNQGADANGAELWRFQCIEDEDSDEKICTTEIATSDGDGEFLVYFAHHTGGRSPLVVTGGEQMFSGMTIKVDEKDPVQADKCDVGMCYYELEKSRLLLNQFKKGHNARVSITNDEPRLILDKDITLRGFSASYAKF